MAKLPESFQLKVGSFYKTQQPRNTRYRLVRLYIPLMPLSAALVGKKAVRRGRAGRRPMFAEFSHHELSQVEWFGWILCLTASCWFICSWSLVVSLDRSDENCLRMNFN